MYQNFNKVRSTDWGQWRSDDFVSGRAKLVICRVFSICKNIGSEEQKKISIVFRIQIWNIGVSQKTAYSFRSRR